MKNSVFFRVFEENLKIENKPVIKLGNLFIRNWIVSVLFRVSRENGSGKNSAEAVACYQEASLFSFSNSVKIFCMPLIWDYNKKELQKTKSGRRLLLERQINYGVFDKEKIKLKEVKKNWHKLNLEPKRRRLFRLLIWGK